MAAFPSDGVHPREAGAGRPLLATLFSPISINGLTLPNRVMMNGLHLGLEKRPSPIGAMARFFAHRARGEVGLLMAGGCSPNVAGRPLAGGFSIDSDESVAEHRRITAAVHAEGGRIALQLVHFGREAFHPDLVSASAVRAHNNVFRPHALTPDEIQATIRDHGNAARRAREAGYDAIEVVGSQGFLLHQFLNVVTNRRKDEWGGGIAGRLRFVREVLRACRQGGGDDFPMIFRLPSLDLMPDGNSSEDVLAILEMAREAGVDLINVGISTHESRVPSISMSVPRAGFAAVVKFVRQHAGGIPIVASNRINDPRTAEDLLLSGIADMVAIGRPLLADPDFVAKARRNAFSRINTCIACNQACLDKALFGKEVSCTVNPACIDGDDPTPSPHPRRFAVVGGGIAGMAAANSLAGRGHAVTLFERKAALGGQLTLAARIPSKQEFLETVRYQTAELARLGVTVRLGIAVTAELLAAENFEHVILAVGARPREFDIESDGSCSVFSFEEVLEHDLPIRYPALVIGGGGVALDLGLHLKARANLLDHSSAFLHHHVTDRMLAPYLEPPPERHVTIVQRAMGNLAPKVGATTRWALMGELAQLGVQVVKGATAKRIADGHLEVEMASGRTERLPAGSVIIAIGQEPATDLAEAVRRLGIAHTIAGGANPALSADVNITSSMRDAVETACAFP